jgi:nucleotide-binding universal stress UspA family protein
LASCWDLPLVVITVDEKNKVNPDTLAEAWHYLETHGIDATYVKVKGPVVQEILITSEERDCDLIIMGGLGAAPSLVGSPGSTVEQVLCEAQKPILICH